MTFSRARGVVALQLKPSNDEALLIGYENGTIVEWDLRHRKVIMIYLYANPDTVYRSLFTLLLLLSYSIHSNYFSRCLISLILFIYYLFVYLLIYSPFICMTEC
jgi:hypothetical protein